MELLIIKTGTRYIREKSGELLAVGLDKASVFPMDRMAQVEALVNKAMDLGFGEVKIKKLVLTEEDLS